MQVLRCLCLVWISGRENSFGRDGATEQTREHEAPTRASKFFLAVLRLIEGAHRQSDDDSRIHSAIDSSRPAGRRRSARERRANRARRDKCTVFARRSGGAGVEGRRRSAAAVAAQRLSHSQIWWRRGFMASKAERRDDVPFGARAPANRRGAVAAAPPRGKKVPPNQSAPPVVPPALGPAGAPFGRRAGGLELAAQMF